MSEWRRVILLSALYAIPALAQNTASIQGSVNDATDGAPISGAFVVATRAGLPPLREMAQSAPDGRLHS
jgi:hypothetical protein